MYLYPVIPFGTYENINRIKIKILDAFISNSVNIPDSVLIFVFETIYSHILNDLHFFVIIKKRKIHIF